MKIDGFIPHATLDAERIMDAVARQMHAIDDPGFCLACGAENGGVEPDAHRYACEACGALAVIGASDLMMELC